jgi:hypothetical protein
MASGSEEDRLSPQPTSLSTTFAISLTTQNVTPPKAGSKAAPKITKDAKTKGTKFSVAKDNYIEFLKLLLSKHGEKRYKILERSNFTFTKPNVGNKDLRALSSTSCWTSSI